MSLSTLDLFGVHAAPIVTARSSTPRLSCRSTPTVRTRRNQAAVYKQSPDAPEDPRTPSTDEAELDGQDKPTSTAEAISREGEKVHSALATSGAPSEWTLRAPTAFEQWIAAVPEPLRARITVSSPECYEAGCIMPLAFAGDPDEMVHALDRFSGWDKWMILGVDTQDPRSSKTAIVLFNPDKPVPL